MKMMLKERIRNFPYVQLVEIFDETLTIPCLKPRRLQIGLTDQVLVIKMDKKMNTQMIEA